MFSNCGLSHKGWFSVSHRAHCSLRGRYRLAARLMMASGADVSKGLLRGPGSVLRGLDIQREIILPPSRWDNAPFSWNGLGCFYSVMLASPPCSRRSWFRRATGAA